jgi:hypothetical protein
MRIAIPTYNRYTILKKSSLDCLRRNNVPLDMIDIWVATEEEKVKYQEVIGSEYNIIVGVIGIVHQRNLMTDHYPEGDELFYLDDDVYSFHKLNNGKLTEIDNLLEFIANGFDILKKTKASLFGVYPVKNHFFMNDEITTHLSHIVGCSYGTINDRSIRLTVGNFKDDYELTLKHYLKAGKVIRFNNMTIKTKFFTEKGGLQTAGMRSWEDIDRSAKELIAQYPEYCKMNTASKKVDKESKKLITQIKFISKKQVYLPDTTSIQDKLIAELKRISWTKNTARPNVSGIDAEKTKEYNDRGDPRHIGKPCLSYTFGFIRPRRAKLGTLELTKISDRYAVLYELLKEYIKEVAPDFEYTSITANKNIVCEKHTDKYNQKPSLAIGLGEYTGGNLIIKDEIHDIRYKPLVFHGKDEHWNDAFEGERFSLIYYTL